jgi:hypothetical protein
MGSQLGRLQFVLVIALALPLGLAAPAGAANFTVNNTGDAGNDNCTDGTCTLRDAFDDAASSGEPDTITVPAGTYSITQNTQLFATDDGLVMLNGAGAGSTIIQKNLTNSSPVFQLNVADAALTVSGVTVRNADATSGAAIQNNSGALTVLSSEFTNNSAANDGGALANSGGTMIVRDSTFTENHSNDDGGFGPGGAISNRAEGTAEITGSVISGNFAVNQGGGGIWNSFASMTIRDTTIDGNFPRLANGTSGVQDDVSGGGVSNEGDLTVDRSAITNNGFETDEIGPFVTTDLGGGIYNAFTTRRFPTGDQPGPVLIAVNSTISGNRARDGGGVYNGAHHTITGFATFLPTAGFLNVTLAANEAFSGLGGGIYSDDRPTTSGNGSPGDVSFKNSVLALNTGGKGEEAANCAGAPPASEGFNLDDGETCSFSGSGDQPSTPAGLGALAGNGGPTFTHALLSGSAAIDSATNDGCPGTDQRGIARPQNSVCDKGAYEVAVDSPPSPAGSQPATAPAPGRIARPSVRVAGLRRACVSRRLRLRIRIGTAGTLRRVTVALDGRRIRSTRRGRFTLNLNARGLRAGRHTLRIVATDTAGGRRVVTRRFTRCARRAQRRAVPRFTG